MAKNLTSNALGYGLAGIDIRGREGPHDSELSRDNLHVMP